MLAAAGNDSQAHEALSSLCQTYWYPLYAYLRRRGLDPEDARDLTQGFLTSLIERQDFEGLRQDRGRFRAFLLASLKHYLSNWSARERTQKRGGGWQMVPLENAEGLYVVEPVNHATPETLFQHESPGTDMEANCSRRRRGLLERPAPPLAQGRSDERQVDPPPNDFSQFRSPARKTLYIISLYFAPERCQNADVDSPFRCSRQHVDKLPAAERRSGIQQSRRHAGSRAVTTWRAA